MNVETVETFCAGGLPIEVDYTCNGGGEFEPCGVFFRWRPGQRKRHQLPPALEAKIDWDAVYDDIQAQR